jgi:DNA-directed RNA polymerase subunit RPC12/RpoP
VFTIKHRTYKVCFDCGREFDLPHAHMPIRSASSRTAA